MCRAGGDGKALTLRERICASDKPGIREP